MPLAREQQGNSKPQAPVHVGEELYNKEFLLTESPCHTSSAVSKRVADESHRRHGGPALGSSEAKRQRLAPPSI
jgi:hypothetical protein